MADLKDLNIDELLNEALEYTNNFFSLYDVKQEILSRFKEQQDRYKALQTFYDAMTDEVIKLKEMIVEKDKVIELMAESYDKLRKKYNEYATFVWHRHWNKKTIKYFTEQIKQELQADEENADES